MSASIWPFSSAPVDRNRSTSNGGMTATGSEPEEITARRHSPKACS